MYDHYNSKFSCIFDSVIEEDLAPWKDGITEEIFDKTKSKNYGSHYQIINHKLYREDSCMFPARYILNAPHEF